MATPNRFFLKWFSNTKTKKKKRVSPIKWGRTSKNAGPQNGDSTGDCEGQARIQIGENVAFDSLIGRHIFLCFFLYSIIDGTFESFDLLIVPFTCLVVVPLILVG